MNLYTYVVNSPTVFVDAYGLQVPESDKYVEKEVTVQLPVQGGGTVTSDVHTLTFINCLEGEREQIIEGYKLAYPAMWEVEWNLNDIVKGRQPFRGQLFWNRWVSWFGARPSAGELTQSYNIVRSSRKGIEKWRFECVCVSKGECTGITLGYVLFTKLGTGGDTCYLCFPLFGAQTARERGRILIHEATHAFGDTEDHGYWRPSIGVRGGYQDPEPPRMPIFLTRDQLFENADTWAWFISEFM